MENETEMIFDRQYNIFNPKEQRTSIVVVGCGSTGSFIILNLAKLGFNNITAIDFDVVGIENIPNQFYRFSDIGKKKIQAIKEMVKDFSGLDIKIIDTKITAENKFMNVVPIDLNTIVVFCLDNLEARELIYNELKESQLPLKIVDTRVGGEASEIHFIDLESDEDKKDYEVLLKAELEDEPCGSKFVIYNILYVASETCNLIKRYDKGEKFPRIIMRNMKGYNILSDFDKVPILK